MAEGRRRSAEPVRGIAQLLKGDQRKGRRNGRKALDQDVDCAVVMSLIMLDFMWYRRPRIAAASNNVWTWR